MNRRRDIGKFEKKNPTTTTKKNGCFILQVCVSVFQANLEMVTNTSLISIFCTKQLKQIDKLSNLIVAGANDLIAVTYIKISTGQGINTHRENVLSS